MQGTLNYLPAYLNAVNSSTPTAASDPVTGTAIATGTLLGLYFDVDDATAASVSKLSSGLLYGGRYRMVQVDAGATAANVKAGTAAAWAVGQSVQNVAIVTAGTGQTNGTYVANASSGSAQIAYTIAGGLLTSVQVISGGTGYTSVPTFTIAAGGTPGTVAAQMSVTTNRVTSWDQGLGTGATAVPARGVFLNSITPGNYGFIQDQGKATVLGAAAIGSSPNIGALVNATANGTVSAAGANAFGVTTIGFAIDLPANSTLFRCILSQANIQG
jgi:hypothetical protein